MEKELNLPPELLTACREIVRSIEESEPSPPDKPLTSTRAAMRERLLEAAEKLLSAEEQTLQARPLAKTAGIALGSVYNIFEDLDALVLEVNGRTLNGVAKMGLKVIEQSVGLEYTARATLFHLAKIYAGFIAENESRWNATLRQTRRIKSELPAWYVKKQDGLFRLIEELLKHLPNVSEDKDLKLYSRTLWGAVNGLITGGFHGNKSGEEKAQDLQRQLDLVICAVLDGLTKAET